MRPPFEPMNMASLADMTRKLAFLLTLASAKRNSEVWAFVSFYLRDLSQMGDVTTTGPFMAGQQVIS